MCYDEYLEELGGNWQGNLTLGMENCCPDAYAENEDLSDAVKEFCVSGRFASAGGVKEFKVASECEEEMGYA